MKKQILSLLDKRTNRLSRLSDYRKVRSLTSTHGGEFEIEISPKARERLEKIDKDIYFSFEHDFGISDKTKEMYWVRVNNEHPEKKTDFTYLATGDIVNRQQSGMDRWGISVKFRHIDMSCTWGQLNALVSMVAKWIDINYGEDCGFNDSWNVNNMKIDFIKNKL